MCSRVLALALVTLTVLACGQDSSGRISGPADEPSLGVVGQQNGRFPVAFAVGHAELTLFSISDKYSFAAVSDPKGVARGAFEWKSMRPDGSMASGTGKVICVNVVGNVAHVSAVFEQDDVTWIEPPLNYAIWTVEDNGQGDQAPPDRVSLLHPAMSAAQAAAHCVTGSFLGLAPNEQGEILVKDRSVLVSDDD
jgi:hypothetical protein